jgi:hypothetical protein
MNCHLGGFVFKLVHLYFTTGAIMKTHLRACAFVCLYVKAHNVLISSDDPLRAVEQANYAKKKEDF